MNHLCEDENGTIHACESGDFHFYQNPIKLVWTRCNQDVTANESFKGVEEVTCAGCKAAQP